MTTTIGAFIGALLVLGLIAQLIAWFVAKTAHHVADNVLNKAMTSDTSGSARQPESTFVVSITESEVSVQRPDGVIEKVSWDDLQQVDLLNTGDGPWLPDVFWVLHGRSNGCAIPWGATGDVELLRRLQELPGFDNQVILSSAATTSERSRTCWRRSSTAS